MAVPCMSPTSQVLKLPVQCVDNADVFFGVVVFDDVTFPISFRPGPSDYNDGQGPHSSVTVFQFPAYEDDRDITMSQGPPATDRDLNPSQEEEVEADE